MYTVNGELFFYGITDSGVLVLRFSEFRPERATYKSLHN